LKNCFIIAEGNNLKAVGSFVFRLSILYSRWIFRLRSNLAILEVEILFLVYFPAATVIASITFWPLTTCLAILSLILIARVSASAEENYSLRSSVRESLFNKTLFYWSLHTLIQLRLLMMRTLQIPWNKSEDEPSVRTLYILKPFNI